MRVELLLTEHVAVMLMLPTFRGLKTLVMKRQLRIGLQIIISYHESAMFVDMMTSETYKTAPMIVTES